MDQVGWFLGVERDVNKFQQLGETAKGANRGYGWGENRGANAQEKVPFEKEKRDLHSRNRRRVPWLKKRDPPEKGWKGSPQNWFHRKRKNTAGVSAVEKRGLYCDTEGCA